MGGYVLFIGAVISVILLPLPMFTRTVPTLTAALGGQRHPLRYLRAVVRFLAAEHGGGRRPSNLQRGRWHHYLVCLPGGLGADVSGARRTLVCRPADRADISASCAPNERTARRTNALR